MKRSDFQFVNPYLVRCDFQLNEKFESKEQKIDINTEMNVHVRKHKEEKRAIVELEVNINNGDENSPFQMIIVMASQFKWESEIEKEMVDTFLNQNAPALLLGYARPIISNITNSSMLSAYNIPFFNFTATEE